MATGKEKLRKLLLYQKFITFCLERELRLQIMPEERMLRWFEYSHLPDHLQSVSKHFGELAKVIVETVDSGPERTVALRKLLESKDAAVRAKLNSGC